MLYLEISCTSNVIGEAKIYLDTGRGFNEGESIRWPICPSQSVYTYTFPIPDAPLINLRLDPFMDGYGELKITNFRVIDRDGHEIHRFSKDDFMLSHQIASIVSTNDGWKLITAMRADDPYAQIKLHQPIVPENMNKRNFLRCLLSCGYLALMLWIFVLAIYFTLRTGNGIRASVKACIFFVFLAILFSAVGNRSLIKNAIRYAGYALPKSIN
jgi:hypothetical protein